MAKPKADGVSSLRTRIASPSTSSGDGVPIGESDKAKLRKLSTDLESIKGLFSRLFNSDVTATAWTYRKFFPHRRPTPPELGPLPEHSFISRHKGIQLAAGVSVEPVYCNPNDPAPTEVFFDSRGQPWPMIARQGWRDRMSILSDGDRQQRFAETLKKANTIVFDYWSFFRTVFFPYSDEPGSESAELWASVVNEVAERAGLSTLPRPDWQVNCSGGWIPAHCWRDRKKLFPLDDFPGYITPEDEERVGEIPELVIAERKAFIQDSEAAAGWLIDLVKAKLGERVATGPAKAARHTAGRKPKPMSREEKRVVDAWEIGKYKRFTELDKALGRPEGYSEPIYERVRKRNERKNRKSADEINTSVDKF